MAETIVTFSSLAQSKNFKLELDNEQNLGSFSFSPGETCFIKLYPAGQNPQIRVSLGSAQIVASNIPQQIEEHLVFAREDTAGLEYPCDELELWQWIGREGGTPIFVEDQVKLPQKTSGILYVKYKTYFDRIAVTCNEEAKILLEAIKEDQYGYIEIDFIPTTKRIYLTVKDACTKTIIPGASVFVDGQFVGLTDNNGRIFLGELRVGEHQLKITALNYQDSDKDTIANDKFIIR